MILNYESHNAQLIRCSSQEEWAELMNIAQARYPVGWAVSPVWNYREHGAVFGSWGLMYGHLIADNWITEIVPYQFWTKNRHYNWNCTFFTPVNYSLAQALKKAAELRRHYLYYKGELCKLS